VEPIQLTTAMPIKTTVITPTRFAQGLTYADFLAQATVNRDKFEMNYKDAPLTDADLAFFKNVAAFAGRSSEGACHRGGLVRRRLSRVPHHGAYCRSQRYDPPHLPARSEPRHHDEFLRKGGSRAIPVFVFYTDDLH